VDRALNVAAGHQLRIRAAFSQQDLNEPKHFLREREQGKEDDMVTVNWIINAHKILVAPVVLALIKASPCPLTLATRAIRLIAGDLQ
jgi:hypothetical protein